MAVRSLNKAQLIGNLTRDPDLRYTATGTPVVNFSIATNREYTPSGSEESVEQTEFHNIVAWAKLAELCDQLLRKGTKVYLEGRLQTRDWQDEESGKKMYRTEIVADNMIVLSPKGDNNGDFNQAAGQDSFGVSQVEEPAKGGNGDEEIPF